MSYKDQNGYTLVELMIVVAILSILAGIAIPIYNGYIAEARLQAVRQNVEPLRLALEDYWLDNQTYIAGTWQPAGGQTLETGALGWRPDGDGDGYNYSVTAGAGGIGSSYALTVADINVATATVTCTRDRTAGSFTCN